jgi:hypothetical protein
MAHDVFISYSSNDQKIVEGLSACLEQNGIRCFVAYRDIPRGVVWAEAITNAIEDCKMMIVVFSEHFNSSKQVDREIEMGSEDKKPILTFRIQNVAFTGAKKYYLKNLNWIDAFLEPELCFGSLCESVKKLLSIDPDKKTDTTAPAPSPTPTPTPPQPEPANQYILKIRPNLTCAVFVDDERRTEALAGKITKLPMNRGTFLLEFVSTENEQDKFVIEEYAIADPEQLLRVDLESITQKRKEKERIAYLEELKLVDYKDASGKYGFKDRAGNIIIQAKYDYVWSFFTDLAPVKLCRKWGYIDKTGKEIISFKYDYVDFFREDSALVKLNDKWGFIDKTGKEIISFKYDYAYQFSEGLALVKLCLKWGYIDKTGKEIISFKYDHAYQFSEGLAAAKLNNKWGFIDKTGKEVIPLKYDYARSFENGKAQVKLKGESFYIDKSGNRIS